MVDRWANEIFILNDRPYRRAFFSLPFFLFLFLIRKIYIYTYTKMARINRGEFSTFPAPRREREFHKYDLIYYPAGKKVYPPAIF